MSLFAAFSSIRSQTGWVKKILISGLILLIPIVGPVYFAGWGVQVLRRCIRKETAILPDANFSETLGLGIKWLVIMLVYNLPAGILNWLGNLLNDNAGTLSATNSTTANVILLLGGVVTFFITMMGYTAMIRLAKSNSLVQSIDFPATFIEVQKFFPLFIRAFLFHLILGFLAGCGAILLIIGLIFTAPFAQAASAHVLGQLNNAICEEEETTIA